MRWAWAGLAWLGLSLAGCGAQRYQVFSVQVATGAPEAGASRESSPPIRVGSDTLEARHPQWDLNQVSGATLKKLPGIDEATVQALLSGRPYEVKRELVRRHILSPQQYERWKVYLVVHHSGHPVQTARKLDAVITGP